MRPHCGGDVRSLSGHIVMLTGKTRIDGQHVLRPDLTHRLQAAGVRRVLQPDTRNRQVTLLVQGDLSSGWLTDPINLRSKKAVFVDNERARGNHICVIDDVGLEELLSGRPAACLETRVVQGEMVEFRAPAPTSPLGGVLQRRSTPVHLPTGLELDLGGLDRGTSAHEDLLEAFQAFLSPLELRVAAGAGPQFDAAWVRYPGSSTLYVLEAKSLTGAREDQQIRLGIGQLLDYCYALRTMASQEFHEVVPVLLLEREPSDAHWKGLSESLGITLTYGPKFPGIRDLP